MKTEDIKVGGFYLWNGSRGGWIEYVTKITENKVYYETYSVYDGLKVVYCCDRQVYCTNTTRPISPAEIFLRYGNDPKVVKWVKKMREQYGQNK